MVFFSIIVPTYNRANLLKRTIESIIEQKYSDFELIIIDDGSTDKTDEVIKDFLGFCKFIKQNNLGPSFARNRGAELSSGQYLVFLDSDDLYFKWTLDIYYKTILDFNFPAIVTGSPYIFTEETNLTNVTYEPLIVESFPDYFASADKWRWFSASSFVIRKDYFEAVNGFNNKWGAEDADILMRLGTCPGFVHICKPYTFAYRQQSISLKSDSSYIKGSSQVLINSEKQGIYPGFNPRALERYQILTRATRPASLDCLHCGLYQDAWKIYKQTIFWNFKLLRWKYLFTFPFLIIGFKIRSTISHIIHNSQ
ncbi:MAG: glycosyltransferase family 2 protein [Gloeotrichia echinulata CP02]|jgi:glycosyltransferase involved in cell wall biosynthesis